MKRDLIPVAVVVMLLVAALLLISSNAASAQTATENQYSSATASPSTTSDQYSNASGSTASPTAPAATTTRTATASPTATASAPIDSIEDPSDTQARVGALQGVLQNIANLAASTSTNRSCNPFGAYGGLFGSPAGCDVGPDSTSIDGHGGSVATNGGSGSFTIQGDPYVPPAMPLGSAGLSAELLKCLLPQGCPMSTLPSSGGWQWVPSGGQLDGLFPDLLNPIVSPDRPDRDGVDDDLDGSDQDGGYEEDN
jgi:hypothetical protein